MELQDLHQQKEMLEQEELRLERWNRQQEEHARKMALLREEQRRQQELRQHAKLQARAGGWSRSSRGPRSARRTSSRSR